MELDLTKVMILLQRKWNSVRELERLTNELEETFERDDGISAAMLLQLRQDEILKIERCTEDMWQLGEVSREASEKVRFLITSDLEKLERNMGTTPEEKKIYEIRRKTQDLLDKLKKKDQELNRRMSGKRSYQQAVK